MTCRNCVHFLAGGVNGSSRPPGELIRGDDVGLCRRYPPVWIPDADLEDGGLHSFAVVHQDHRCGEWSYFGPWEFLDDPDDPDGGGTASANITRLFPDQTQAA